MKDRIRENGIDYVLVGDYYIPDLELPEEECTHVIILLFAEQFVQCFSILVLPFNPTICTTAKNKHGSRAGGCKGYRDIQLVFSTNISNIAVLNCGLALLFNIIGMALATHINL